ncbi:MAG: hypothetical protein ACYTHK_08875 [Planctomycetota bacterium]|jgi:hypothetical protein
MKSIGVIEFDGRALRAAVVRVDRGEIERWSQPCETVAELGPLPRPCIVLSDEVAEARVRLPAGRRSPEEMAQLLRWELEPQLATRDQFDANEADYAVGWSLQDDSECLAAAMGRKRRRWWREQLADRRLRLLGIYARTPDFVRVASHAVGRAPAASAVAVPPRDPGAPIRQRPSAWWAAATLLFGLTALGFDGLLDRSRHEAEADLARATEPWERVDREIRRLESRHDAATALLAETNRLDEERRQLADRSDRLERGPARRARVVTAILDALAGPANGAIAIDRVAETKPGEIVVEGCAVSERAVQVYARAVAVQVLPLGLWVVEPSARAGERSYRFSFRLTEGSRDA